MMSFHLGSHHPSFFMLHVDPNSGSQDLAGIFTALQDGQKERCSRHHGQHRIIHHLDKWAAHSFSLFSSLRTWQTRNYNMWYLNCKNCTGTIGGVIEPWFVLFPAVSNALHVTVPFPWYQPLPRRQSVTRRTSCLTYINKFNFFH